MMLSGDTAIRTVAMIMIQSSNPKLSFLRLLAKTLATVEAAARNGKVIHNPQAAGSVCDMLKKVWLEDGRD